MLINKSQRYLLGLVIVTTLSANIQSVSALNLEPVHELEGSATLVSTGQTNTSTSVLNSTFAPLATAGLHIFNGNQYKPHHDNELFKNTDTMPLAMKEVVADFTESKYEKTPVGANKIFIDSQNNTETMVVSMTSESQPNQIGHSLDQNRRYVGKSQYSKRGTLVSTNYNTVSMLRTMDDLQNIGYLGMNEVNNGNAEPLSDALTTELKETSYVAFVPDNACANLVDLKLLAACQNTNLEKTAATMPMMREKNWSEQMTKDFSFSQNMNIYAQKVSR